MKKYLFFLLPILLLASCSYTKDETPSGPDLHLSQQSHFLLASEIDTVYQHADKQVDGGKYLVFDSVYTMHKTWGQAWAVGRSDGSVILFWIGIVIIIFFFFVFYHAQNNQRDPNSKTFLVWVIPMVIGAGITGAAFGWDKWNSERDISKKEYIQYMQTDGDLHNWWKTPAKSY